MSRKIAGLIGGGVIGGGWAARFLQAGWDVRVFDPDPQAERKIGEVLENARRSAPGLSDVALPEEGTLSFHATIAEAVAGADWIQESVPERLDLKLKVYAEVQAACDAGAVIGSSTSGFKPSELQDGAARPGQIVVAHPFNPVYLLPLVEVVGTEANDGELIARAQEMLRGTGMYPLHVRKEIDAHIADRLLEAVWRECLWLVTDGIATSEEIDDAIRFGFGLRWAQMGIFDTYRIAGGEAGMKYFMEQFGPALKWPWTKLMDVPEFTEELVELIAGQSDAQSGHMSIREMEQIRDDNLVAMIRALKDRNWGAGKLMNERDAAIMASDGTVRHAEQLGDAPGPIVTGRRAVPVDWLDYNGHMTEARYLHAFADATTRLMEIVGCDQDYIAQKGSFFTAETHIRHLGEALLGQRIEIRTQVLLGEGKKLHLWHEMFEGERLLATGEHFLVHVDMATRKPAPFGEQIAGHIARIAASHAGLLRPEGAGRAIGAPR
ncbi:carnitine 3-dehydrogenase [Salinihabitans flavidus]|uniref:L-carnitine dehydrogenase n=1 Tax=Salinihabitans flavidus TaxID=569882 RepID=A0A1H8TPQ5_9RHOB|nr:carnitine 3-dehydrogenase [Salinihabitans flavidus]SEO93030.1 carnitine 3-dehydrogenase [Salinihabitans flavidus]